MNKTREYIIILYEIYKNLLNDKEKSYFEYYYFEDYSLNEIAELNNVSRAYVSKIINKIEDKLINFEESLKINNKNSRIREYLEKIDNNEIKNRIEELL